jgi:hypothetical protein
MGSIQDSKPFNLLATREGVGLGLMDKDENADERLWVDYMNLGRASQGSLSPSIRKSKAYKNERGRECTELDIFPGRCRMINRIGLTAALVKRLPLR